VRAQAIASACFTIVLALCVAGCARNKELIATGGSRADGTVTMSYEFGALENPKLDIAQGVASATERCRAWGYTSAEPFGGDMRQCQAPSQYGCMRWLVSVTYQCLGANRPG
jgi:hypothetical protein